MIVGKSTEPVSRSRELDAQLFQLAQVALDPARHLVDLAAEPVDALQRQRVVVVVGLQGPLLAAGAAEDAEVVHHVADDGAHERQHAVRGVDLVEQSLADFHVRTPPVRRWNHPHQA